MTEPFRPAQYWEERLSANYDCRGVGDITFSRAYNNHLYRVRRHVFRRILAQIPVRPEVARVLDVGSGTGVYVEEWLRWGAAQLTGCDISDTAVARLTARFPDREFVQADISATNPPKLVSGPFDIVSAFDVLFHVVDDVRYERAVTNIAAALRPGGWFLYSDNLLSRTEHARHQALREECNIVDTLTKNGLRIARRVPMFVLMNEPVRTRSIALRRWFAGVARFAAPREALGAIVGGVLLPFEMALTGMVRQGPSTEILVCQKA